MIGGMVAGVVTKSEYSSTETSTTTSHILKQHSSTDSDVIRTTNTSSQESMDEQQRHVTLVSLLPLLLGAQTYSCFW